MHKSWNVLAALMIDTISLDLCSILGDFAFSMQALFNTAKFVFTSFSITVVIDAESFVNAQSMSSSCVNATTISEYGVAWETGVDWRHKSEELFSDCFLDNNSIHNKHQHNYY